ncbi:MAG: hypothetical protein H6817_03445 [Phycisphaerales bacterium]|nr:hypothetical protein [Phycisphaerales bacterium]
MNARMREDQWQMTAQKRRKPGAGAPRLIPFDGGEIQPVDPQQAPSEIALEATGPSGEPAHWLDDFFWVDLLQAWSRESMTIRFLPTPDALLHPVVIHQVNMLRRVATNWRIAGHCYVHDLAPDGMIAQAALSPYHEIHLIDGRREGSAATAHALRIEDALARIRRVQVANSRNTPILVCVRESDKQPQGQWAPQAPTRRTPAGAVR